MAPIDGCGPREASSVPCVKLLRCLLSFTHVPIVTVLGPCYPPAGSDHHGPEREDRDLPSPAVAWYVWFWGPVISQGGTVHLLFGNLGHLMFGVATPGFIFYLLTCLYGVLPTTLYQFGRLVAFIYKGGENLFHDRFLGIIAI